MISYTYVIKDENGMHARPAAMFAQGCSNFNSTVTLTANGKTVDAKNVTAILSLGCKQNDEIKIDIDGDDENACFDKVMHVLDTKFNRLDTMRPLKVAFFGAKDYDKTFFVELSKDKGPGTIM